MQNRLLSNKTIYVYWLYLTEWDDIYKDGYVGITDNIYRRFCKHRKKFGKFNFKIIFTGSLAQAYALELMLRPKPDIGWNKAKGGLQFGTYGPNLGRKHSQTTLNKISWSNKGQKRSEETRAKLKNRVFTDEWKTNIGISAKGRKLSDEGKAKVSEALRKRERKSESHEEISKSVAAYHAKRHAKIDAFIASGTCINYPMAMVDAEAPTIKE